MLVKKKTSYVPCPRRIIGRCCLREPYLVHVCHQRGVAYVNLGQTREKDLNYTSVVNKTWLVPS